jgi:hypothetical protein
VLAGKPGWYRILLSGGGEGDPVLDMAIGRLCFAIGRCQSLHMQIRVRQPRSSLVGVPNCPTSVVVQVCDFCHRQLRAKRSENERLSPKAGPRAQ